MFCVRLGQRGWRGEGGCVIYSRSHNRTSRPHRSRALAMWPFSASVVDVPIFGYSPLSDVA